MIDHDTADQIVAAILDELVRGKPPVSGLATWPQALVKWDALSEQAQIEIRRSLISLALAHN